MLDFCLSDKLVKFFLHESQEVLVAHISKLRVVCVKELIVL